jgi:hypothetical protein
MNSGIGTSLSTNSPTCIIEYSSIGQEPLEPSFMTACAAGRYENPFSRAFRLISGGSPASSTSARGRSTPQARPDGVWTTRRTPLEPWRCTPNRATRGLDTSDIRERSGSPPPRRGDLGPRVEQPQAAHPRPREGLGCLRRAQAAPGRLPRRSIIPQTGRALEAGLGLALAASHWRMSLPLWNHVVAARLASALMASRSSESSAASWDKINHAPPRRAAFPLPPHQKYGPSFRCLSKWPPIP